MVTRSGHFDLIVPVFCVGAACLLVFFFRNTEKQDRLQPEILSALGFIDNFRQRELKNTWHARDRVSSLHFFAYKKRQDEIMRAQLRLADEVSESTGTPQTARAMHQSSHERNVPVRWKRRKLDGEKRSM